MIRTFYAVTLILLLLLSACQASPAVTQQPIPSLTTTNTPANSDPAGYPVPTPTTPATTDSYPAPVQPTPDPNAVYPAPSASGAELFPPLLGDENKSTGQFFVESVDLKPSAEKPGYTDVVVSGNLPTPCNELRVKVSRPDKDNKIVVEIYSVVEKDKVCSQQLQPFEGAVASLGGYPAGTYSVMVNEQPVGEFAVQ